MSQRNPLLKFILQGNLIVQILIGMAIAIIVGPLFPEVAKSLGLLGSLFTSALKAAAPVLVFVLVIASIANHKVGQKTNMGRILLLYLLGTFSAALVAVIASFMFPTTLMLPDVQESIEAPNGIIEVMKNLLLSAVDNPLRAIINANFIGILAWAICLGIALRHASDSTKTVVTDVAHAVTAVIKIIIRFAPLGILGLLASTIAETGLEVLKGYIQLLIVLIGCMLFVALVINPIIVFSQTRTNPYPLVFTCLRESGITAFFTRSSAANVPVNMELCRKLKLNEDTYSISIPLGATINMAGAAITITVLTLAAVHTLGIQVDLVTALLLSIVAALCACGASGVAGGSLLLIPLACSLFNIPIETATLIIAIGYSISVLQDSTETALNSSTDALFTAAVCIAEDKKNQQASLNKQI